MAAPSEAKALTRSGAMTSKVPTSDLKRTVKANRTSKSAGFMVVLWWFDEDFMGIIWDLMEFIRTYCSWDCSWDFMVKNG